MVNRYGFLIWILLFTAWDNALAAVVISKAIPEPKNEISGIQLKFRKGFDPNLTVSGSPDYKPDINHEFGASLGYAKNNLLSPGFMGSANIDKFSSKGTDTQGMIVGGMEGNATFSFNSSFVPYMGINLSRYYATGENQINYKAGFGFQAGVLGQIWKNIGYTLSYQRTKNSIKLESPEYRLPGIKVKMKSVVFNVVVTI